MNSESQYLELPEIREHDFQSRVPVIGPVIQLVRRTLYQLTAKWSVIVVIDQQNRINQMFAQYLRELDGRLRELDNQLREHGDQLRDIDDRLIEQDRDLAYLARVVAELEIQQRHLAQLSLPQTYSEPQSTSSE